MSAQLLRLASELFDVPLFADPRKVAIVAAVLGDRVGLDGDMDAFMRSAGGAPLASRAPSRGGYAGGYRKIGGGIALVSIVGSLVTRAGGMDAESGLVSYDQITAGVRGANADPEVTSILLDFHSAGGSAAGCNEGADVVNAVAQKRPVVAVCNSLCCSAAYMIASAATKIIATKTAVVGSIGVVLLHVDRSQQMAGKGLVPSFFFAGKHKIDGNDMQPLTSSVKDDLQAEVQVYYDLFVRAVAGYRPKLSEAAIRATEAKVYLGAEAVRVGLADEVGSIDTAMAELARLHPVVKAPFNRTEFIYGKTEATLERLNQERAAGVRAGMAAAMAGRTS